jgi:acyl-CoA thioester hydrolase
VPPLLEPEELGGAVEPLLAAEPDDDVVVPPEVAAVLVPPLVPVAWVVELDVEPRESPEVPPVPSDDDAELLPLVEADDEGEDPDEAALPDEAEDPVEPVVPASLAPPVAPQAAAKTAKTARVSRTRRDDRPPATGSPSGPPATSPQGGSLQWISPVRRGCSTGAALPEAHLVGRASLQYGEAMDSGHFRSAVSVDIPVAWGEMDAFGHVNNTVFFRWCETARIAYFDQAGVTERMKAEGIGPILGHASMAFRQPVAYPDTIRAEAGVEKVGTTSFVLAYRLTSLSKGAVIGEGDSVVVMVDYRRGGKVPLDERLKATLSR